MIMMIMMMMTVMRRRRKGSGDQDLLLQMTSKPNTQNRAPLMRLSGQLAFKVRLTASSKRNGDEWAWVVNAALTAAAVWAERACEVAGDAS